MPPSNPCPPIRIRLSNLGTSHRRVTKNSRETHSIELFAGIPRMNVREDFFCQIDEAGAAVATHPGADETGESRREGDEGAG